MSPNKYQVALSVYDIPMTATPQGNRTWLVTVDQTGTPVAVVRRTDPRPGIGKRTYITDNHPAKGFPNIETAVTYMATEWRAGR